MLNGEFLRPECKNCSNIITLEYLKNKGKIIEEIDEAKMLKNRKSKLSRYNMNIGDYNKLLKNQNGVCAICGAHNDISSKYGNLSIDHNHKTGKVRGLLCRTCNSGLGQFKDNIELLEKAINYLGLEYDEE